MTNEAERKELIEALITGRGGEKLWDNFVENVEEYLIDNGVNINENDEAYDHDMGYALEVLARAYISPTQ